MSVLSPPDGNPSLSSLNCVQPFNKRRKKGGKKQVNLWFLQGWNLVIFRRVSSGITKCNLACHTLAESDPIWKMCQSSSPRHQKRRTSLVPVPSSSLPLNRQGNFLSPANMQSTMWSLAQFRMFPGCLHKERQLQFLSTRGVPVALRCEADGNNRSVSQMCLGGLTRRGHAAFNAAFISPNKAPLEPEQLQV